MTTLIWITFALLIYFVIRSFRKNKDDENLSEIARKSAEEENTITIKLRLDDKEKTISLKPKIEFIGATEDNRLIQPNNIPPLKYDDRYSLIVTEDLKRKIEDQLKIKYLDGYGNLTERFIDVTSFSRGNRGYMLHAYCHLRNDTRSFRSNAIEEVIDTASGELITDLIEHLERKYIQMFDYRLDSIFQKYGDSIFILIYFAAIDGSIQPNERKFICDYCTKFDNTIGIFIWDKLIKDIYRPSEKDFHKYVGNLKEKSTEAQELYPVAVQLVNIPKNKPVYKIDALEYFTNNIKREETK